MRERDCFEQIVEDYQAMVFRTAMGFVHEREEAEDITQDVFIKAYRKFDQFRGDSAISTWLYRITVNVALDYVSHKRRKIFVQYGHDMMKKWFDRQDQTQSAHQQMELSERGQIIRKAIDELPDKQRTAFILSRYDDLPQADIAAIMILSEGAVEQLLQRAKAKLQKKLQKFVGNI
ncbi:MAG: RNA polymerase sigma factor [Bacteroidales bacterium]|jgi:RNA polymerase sigma-70 factor (ECF subfamily)|nr:RNA polymerase sigma factor [Bacteroidales bacterium]